MDKLAKLRAKIGSDSAELKILLEVEAPTEEQTARMEALTKSLQDDHAELEKREKAMALVAKAAVPAATPAIGHNGGPLLDPAPTSKRIDDTEALGLYLQAVVLGKVYSSAPLDLLENNGFERVAALFRGDKNSILLPGGRKTLNTGNPASGGVLIPDRMSDSIIELLRPAVSFLQGNPRVIDMPEGNYSQPAGATGSSASYTGELINAPVTEPTFRDISMFARELKALVPMSNRFLSFSIAGAREFVERDLRSAMAEKMDYMAYFGDGVGGRPLGIFNIGGIGTGTATNSLTPTIAQVDADLRKAINYLVTRNVGIDSARWIFTERVLGYLEDMRDGNGNPYFPALATDNPRLKRIPVLRTTNWAENLGGGANETTFALVAFNHVLFGDTKAVTLRASDEAAYYDAGGTVRSSFQRGETLILATAMHDFALRHLPAVYTATAVKWGA